jgi:hypothetical protein
VALYLNQHQKQAIGWFGNAGEDHLARAAAQILTNIIN